MNVMFSFTMRGQSSLTKYINAHTYVNKNIFLIISTRCVSLTMSIREYFDKDWKEIICLCKLKGITEVENRDVLSHTSGESFC